MFTERQKKMLIEVANLYGMPTNVSFEKIIEATEEALAHEDLIEKLSK
jgi:hypothetical protein